MAYKLVVGEGLRTRYEGAPAVVIHAVEDAPLALEVVLQTEPGSDGSEVGFTRLLFGEVFEYRWIKDDWTYFVGNRDDYEFALIEITDSEQIQQLVNANIYADQPPGQRLGGVLDEADLRHYRIGSDHHGCYDVVCVGLEITRFRAVRAERG